MFQLCAGDLPVKAEELNRSDLGLQLDQQTNLEVSLPRICMEACAVV